MIGNPGLRWALTILFAVTIGLYARLGIGACAWQQRVAWWLHVLMAVAMIAMAWPAGMGVPTILYVLFFTAATMYFAYLALFGPAVDHPVYHGVMMAAMVAMAVMMPSAGMPMTSSMAMGADHNMAMPGTGAGQVASSGPPEWVMVSGGLAAAGFLGAALWFVAMLVRGPRRRFADVLMTLGMGAAFAAIAI